MTDTNKINEQNLENVAGGTDWIHDPANFVWKTVCNVVTYPGTPSGLTFRREPNGEQIPGILLQNGNMVRVHKSYTEGGWPLAIAPDGRYGFVNPNYLR